MPDQVWDYRQAPFNGPFDVAAILMDGAQAADLPIEGVWTFTGGAKAQSMEVGGSMSTLALGLYGSNLITRPLNQYTVTIGGSATATDVLTLTFKGSAFQGGSYVFNYTVQPSATLNSAAAGMAAAIAADPTLAPLGFVATSLAAVVTINFPSVAPGYTDYNPSTPPPSNWTRCVASVSGGASETLTVAAGGNGTSIQSVTALGFVSLTTALPRWITGRLTTLTGTGAIITAAWHGAG